ncbi:MAG: NAD-dependent protein deacylase [Candidatus Helarchaeota archaeon]|nr:NAD-dependent protein deacylase [Candidatus Helarchaeota archaeon]
MDETLKQDIVDAANLIIRSKYVVATTGAGISVESGIPPFRGPGGLWTKYGEPPLDGYQRFLANPKAYWESRMKNPPAYLQGLRETIAKAEPNPAHLALAEAENIEYKYGKLLKWLITQNVDNLHRRARSTRISEIHGNATFYRCVDCNARYPREGFKIDMNDLPPKCPECKGIIKSDGVSFGEPIPRDTLTKCFLEISKCDCLLIVGTSGTVYPAASFPTSVKGNGGILIDVNLYDSQFQLMSDIALKGKSGEILPVLIDNIKELI